MKIIIDCEEQKKEHDWQLVGFDEEYQVHWCWACGAIGRLLPGAVIRPGIITSRRVQVEED